MSKKKKILIIIVSAILVVALGLGIFCIISPRAFLQLFMSDISYATTVVSKNAVKAYKNINALEVTGNMETDISISSLTDKDSIKAINDYVSSLDINANIYVDNGKIKGIADLSDTDGSVLTAEFVSANKKTYLNIDQFGLGWLDMTKESSTSSGGNSGDSTAEPIDLTNLVSVDGDTIKISFTVSQLEQGVADDFIPEEYRDKFKSALSGMVSGLSNYGIETVNTEIYVDNRNNIVGAKVVLSGEENNVIISAAIEDDSCSVQMDVTTKTYGSVSMNLVMKPCVFKNFDVPTETTKFDKSTIKTAAMTYITTTLPEEHPAFEEVYSSVFSTVVTNAVNQMIGSLLGDNANSFLSGEVSSETISNVVNGFISAFKEGLSE